MKRLDLNKRQSVILIIAVLLAVVGILLFYITFNYEDGQSILAWSVNNWDLLVENRWGDFYTDKAVNLRGALHTDMEFEGMISPFMYIPESIWCLPVWLTHYFNGNYYIGTLPCIYWYKAFLLLATIITAVNCFHIVKRFTDDHYRSFLSAFFVMASPEILLSTGYAGQDEIVYLCFLLLAINAMLLQRRRWFLAWSTCAVTLCPIVIIPLLAIVLLKEKRIVRILISAGIMVLPTLFWSVVSNGMENRYTWFSTVDQAERVLDYITIPILSGTASVFVIAVILYYFYCYVTEGVDDYQLIWLVSLSVLWLSFFTNSLFYRSMLYVPFFAILLLAEKRLWLALEILLFTVLQYLRFFTLGVDSTQTMNTYYTVKAKWIVSLCERAGSTKHLIKDSLVEKIIEKVPELYLYTSAMNGVCIAIVLLLLWITFSGHSGRVQIEERPIIETEWSVMAYGACGLLYMIVFYMLLLK